MTTPADKSADGILRRNALEAARRGQIRPNEVDKVVEISHTLYTGDTSNGRATDQAVALVREGKV